MTSPNDPPRSLRRHLRLSDLRAAAQLAVQATHGVIDITEGVHQSVRNRLGLSSGAVPEQTGGLTGRVYRGVRGATQLVSHATDALLGALLPLLDDPAKHPESSPAREAVLAALNGVMGDKLLAMGNALAQPMELRQGGRTLSMTPDSLAAQLKAATGTPASPHLLLLAHGLCMNDTQWRRAGHDHGEHLAQALGCTPVYLRYNSGLHTSVNGRELALMLEQLSMVWPVPLQRITLLGHSMGGLVLRSAVQVARDAGLSWTGQLRELVFLGTPHHGAPLERAGHGVDLLLAATPFTAPFARLGRLRSAGITDLRHGHVQDADWKGRDLFASSEDHRVPLPLPEGVDCFALAGTLAGQRGALADRLMGDGLVPLSSAMGQHDEPTRRLPFDKRQQRIFNRTGHLDLLASPKVAMQLQQWLAPAPGVRT